MSDSYELTTGVQWKAGHRGLVSSEAPSPLAFSDADDLGGLPGAWTPQTLLLASVETSLMLRFLADARSAGLGVLAYRSSAIGTWEAGASAEPALTRMVIKPNVRVPSAADVEVARGLLADAAQACSGRRVVKAEVTLEPVVRAAAKPASGPTVARKRSNLDLQLSAEHRALDQILVDVEWLGERRSFVPAGKRFGEFRLALERHLADEDRILAIVARHSPEAAAVAAKIAAEHARLGQLVEGVASAVSRWDFSDFCRLVCDLGVELDRHQQNEEQLLHPAIEQLLTRDPNCFRILEMPVRLAAPATA